MKKCLQLITSLNIGGTERFLLNLIRYLKDDYNFTVAYLKERGPIADEIEKMHIPVFKVNGVRDLAHLLGQHRMDIVHTHLYRANVIGRLAAHSAGVKQIISSQRSIDGWKSFYHIWLDHWTARYANVIIANSQAARDILVLREKIPAAKIKVVYNGIEPYPEISRQELSAVKHDLNIPDSTPIIGCVTRFHKEKGAHLLPEIIRLVAARRPDVKFLLVGDGPEKNSVGQALQEMRLEKLAHFTGFQQNIIRFVSFMDVFFLPSREESMPLALLESMGAGVPSICTDVGGAREIITDKETGLLVKAGSPAAVAEAIIWLLENREKAQAMGDRGKQIVLKNFILADKMQQIKEIYG
jgi:glycosyltransferase involved in cell wall biosynthesis